MSTKPVSQQPVGQVQMMPFPGQMEGVAPGMEYLAQIDQLICKQEVHLLEVITGWECKNKFRIMNSMNQQAYYGFEESSICQRMCCGPNRGFTFHIQDNNQQEVITLERPFKCCAGCCWCADGCCMYPIFVHDKFGNKLGMIRMKNSKCSPHFGIFDASDELIYEMWGPCCPCQCCCGCTDDINFPVTSVKDSSVVGNISKQWFGTFKEMISDADTFGVTFPVNLDVRHKALMLASVFMIDFMVFEQQKNNNN